MADAFIELDDHALRVFATAMEDLPRLWVPLFVKNMRSALERIKRDVEDATPVDPEHAGERRTWRSYYPGGSRMRGSHIQENWFIDVGTDDTGDDDGNVVFGELGNWHPGALPLTRGPREADTIHLEPVYANPATGKVPEFLAFRSRRTDKWVFVKEVDKPTSPKDPDLERVMYDSILETGKDNASSSFRWAFIQTFYQLEGRE